MDKATHQTTDEDWEDAKSCIRTLYLEKDMSLSALRKEMSLRGLRFSKAQLEYKLKQWGFRKYLSTEAWQYIGREVEKRKRDGKETDILVSGVSMKRAKVMREINRHRPVSMQAKFMHVASPKLPEDLPISICTPGPVSPGPVSPGPASSDLISPGPISPSSFPINLLSASSSSPMVEKLDLPNWPRCLPWLQFQGMTQNSVCPISSNISPSLNSNFPIGLSGLFPTELSIRDGNKVYSSVPALTIMATSRDNSLAKSATHVAAEIGRIVPETQKGDHLALAEVLLSRNPSDVAREGLKMLVFEISNNIFQGTESSWAALLECLDSSGLLERPFQLDLYSLEDVTMLAFTENLFKLSLERLLLSNRPWSEVMAHKLLLWLLKAGYNANQPLSINGLCCTPLQHAAIYGDRALDCASMLLRSGADVEMSTKEHPWSPMGIAFHIDKRSVGCDLLRAEGMVKLLWNHGANVQAKGAELLSMAIHLDRMTLVTALLKQGVDLNYALEQHSGIVSWKTAISDAAGCVAGRITAMFMLQHVVDTLGYMPRTAHPTCNLVFPNALITAASRGYNDIIEYLTSLGARPDSRNSFLISPLHAAVVAGHQHSCELLVRLGAPVNEVDNSTTITALHLACLYNQKSIASFLIKTGADINAVAVGGPTMKSFLTRFDQEATRPRLKTNKASWTCLDFASNNHRHGADAGIEMILGNAVAMTSLPSTSLMQSIGHEPELTWSSFEPPHSNDAPKLTASRQRNDEVQNSELELAILEGSKYLYKQVISRGLPAYDASVLCTALQLLVEEELPDPWFIEMLLRGRPKDAQAHILEGTAVAIAALVEDKKLLRGLLDHLPVINECSVPPLWRQGPDVSPKSKRGFSCMNFWKKNRENQSKLTASPLIFIAEAGDDWETVSLLQSFGYKADIMTLQWAIEKGHWSVVKLFLQNGVVQTNTGHTIYTPLQRAVLRGNHEIVSLLLEAGCDSNEKAGDLHSQLHSRSADILRSSPGRSALQIAVEAGDLKMIDILLRAGADVNGEAARVRGATALQLASAKGFLGIVRQLLGLGAQIDAPGADIGGRTALEAAAENGRIDTVQYLLTRELSTTTSGRRRYHRAVRLATREGHHQTALLIKTNCGWSILDEEKCFGDVTLLDDVCHDDSDIDMDG